MTEQKSPKKTPAAARVRRMRVRQLREIFAGVTPCPCTQGHTTVERKSRARQMLESFIPILAEREDGHLDPRGYPASTAALLQALDAEDEVEVMIRAAASAPPASSLPLVLEVCHRFSDSQLQDFAMALFAYWRGLHVESATLEIVSRELSQSATTYARKVGLPYAIQDGATEPGKASDSKSLTTETELKYE